MPRNPGGVYSLPAGSIVTNGTTIDASQHNTPLNDIAADLNAVRPISSGGTGASSASDARTALGVQAASAVLTDLAANLTADAGELNALDGVTATGTSLVRAANAATARTALGFGSTVLRTLHNTLPAEFSTTSGTFQAIGLSQAITPASAANRVLITLNISASAQRTNRVLGVEFELRRGATQIGLFFYDHDVATASALVVPIPMHSTLLDAPNTTGEITYSVWARNVLTGNEPRLLVRQSSFITLQEIAG